MVSKSFDISNATNQPAPGMLKSLSTLSATAAIRSAVEQEDINHTENQGKKKHFSCIFTQIKPSQMIGKS